MPKSSQHDREPDGYRLRRFVEDGYANVYNWNAKDNTTIVIEINVRSADWNSFEEYTLKHGHGRAVDAVSRFVSTFLIYRSSDITLDPVEVKTAFSKYAMDWYEKFTKYLVTAHITVILVSLLIQYFSPDQNRIYELTTYAYQFSLALALLAWLLLLVRKSYLRDDRSFTVAAEKEIIVGLSKWSGRILFFSAIFFLLTVSMRILVFLVRFGPQS